MSLNIKNSEVERLAAEVALMCGETKTEAIRRALLERRSRLRRPSDAVRTRGLRSFLEREVWSQVPHELKGRKLGSGELDEILGFGPDGV